MSRDLQNNRSNELPPGSAEIALKRLAAIVESSDDAIIGKDLNSIVTSWNRSAERIFGYSASEMVGTSILRLIPADRLTEEDQILEKIRRGENVDHFETLRQTRDGRLINVAVTVSPIKDSAGKVIGVSKIARDITGHKAMDETLRRQAALFDQTYDAIFVWNWNGPVTFWNRGAENLYGFSRLEAIGKTSHELLQTTFPNGKEPFILALEQQGRWEGELRHVTRAGARIIVETRMTLIRDSERPYVLKVNRDITSRKGAEETLRLLSSAMEQSKESILITDAELDLPGPRIIFVNPAFTQMTGYTGAEVIGKTPRILQGPHTDKLVLSRLRETLKRGEAFAGETVNYRKDGKEFELEWQVAPLRDANGKITHFVATQHDITARKRREAKVRQSQK